MLTRIVTGVVLAPIVIAAAWFSPGVAGVGLAIAATAIAAYEYLSMWSVKEVKPAFWFFLAWTVLAPVLARIDPTYLYPYLLATPAMSLGAFLLAPSRIPKAFAESAVTAMGALYVGLLMSAVVLLATVDGWGGSGLLTLFAVVWLGDSAAYFGGKSLGRHKLHARVSPKKTMEGSIFGLLGSVGGAFLIHALFSTPLSPLQLVLVGVLGGVAEQAGDLCESVLKRSVGVKDSGNILPGHGGMLDRIDGLLFAAPIVYGFYVCCGA